MYDENDMYDDTDDDDYMNDDDNMNNDDKLDDGMDDDVSKKQNFHWSGGGCMLLIPRLAVHTVPWDRGLKTIIELVSSYISYYYHRNGHIIYSRILS